MALLFVLLAALLLQVPASVDAAKPPSKGDAPSTPARGECPDAPTNEGLTVAPPAVPGGPPTVSAGAAPAARCGYLVRVRGQAAARDIARSLPPQARAKTYRHALRGFAAQLTRADVAALRNHPKVASVTRDWTATIADDQASPPWGLDRIDQRALPLSNTYSHDPAGGAGVMAYVIDTGIRASHVDFGGRVTAGANFVAGSTGTDDCHGHGTHVAGTIGGTTYGVAKAVTLVPVRTLDCGGSAPYSTILAAIDWVAEDHDAGDPAVVNMSLGGPVDPAMNDAIAALVADGIVVVVAAGNAGADACAYSPASASEALTAGATDSSDTKAGFSNFGSCLDLFGPGVDILSAGTDSDTATRTASGTSMASPHVAGVTAVLFGRNPAASPETIEAAIIGDSTADVVASEQGSPDRLVHLALPVPGAQAVYFALPRLYLNEPAVTLDATSSSGTAATFQSQTPATCTVTGGQVAPIAQGTCTIRASVPAGGGWVAASLVRSTAVHSSRQTISIPNPWAELAWSASVNPGATASSGLSVTYVSQSTVCDVSGSSVRGVEVGDCLVSARQAGNATFGPAPVIWFVRSVRPATQTLSGPSATTVREGASSPYVGTSSRGLPVEVTSASPAVCAAGPGTITGVAAGTCDLRLTQSGSAAVRASGSSELTVASTETPFMTRIAVRDDGRPVIVYTAGPEIRLVDCNDATCSDPAEKLLVDLLERFDWFESPDELAIWDLALVVSDDRPVVLYAGTEPRTTEGDVQMHYTGRVASCADPDCDSTSDVEVTDGVVDVAATLASDGTPLLVAETTLISCADAACTDTTLRDLRAGGFGANPAIALGTDGFPVIVYLADSGNAVWSIPTLLRCMDPLCATGTRIPVGESLPWFKPAIAVPPDNRPVVFWTEDLTAHFEDRYMDWRVMRARCDDVTCASVTTGVVDHTPPDQAGHQSPTWAVAGLDLSAAVGPDGHARVSYLTWRHFPPSDWQTWGAAPWIVVVAACGDAQCSTVRRGYVDEWSRTTWLPFSAAQAPIVVAHDGTLHTAFGFAPMAFTSTDGRATGLKLASCRTAVCGTEASATVIARDHVAPSVTAPTISLRKGAALSGSSIPVTVTWSGSDANPGLAKFELSRSTDNGVTWTPVSISASATSLKTTVPSSGTIRYRVRATDKDGNVSGWAQGGALKASLVQQQAAPLKYSTGWTGVASSSYSGGSARYAKVANRSVSYTFTGRAIGFVTATGPTRGKVKVYLNGTFITTLDLRTSSTKYRMLAWQRTWATSATRTIKLVVVGTTGRPRIDLDAFAVGQ